MQIAMEQPAADRRKTIMKAGALAVFIVGAVVLVRFTSLRDYLTPQALGAFLSMAGFWAPVVFVIIYAVGVCLFVPGTLLTGLGAGIFGAYLGFVYVWIGAMLGAIAAFWIGRTLGRDFATSLIGDKLKKHDDAIERNGVATVLYLRLVYFPFTPLNFGLGLTKVRFRDYVAGTGLGILVGTFIFTFFIGTIRDVLMTRKWAELLSLKVFFSIGLFVFSFFIPAIIKKLRKEGPDAVTAESPAPIGSGREVLECRTPGTGDHTRRVGRRIISCTDKYRFRWRTRKDSCGSLSRGEASRARS